MSYDKNLGRVKGDDGETFTPNIIPKNGKQYIQFLDKNNNVLSEYEIKTQVFVPQLKNDGTLEFTLQSYSNNIINVGRVKGDQGQATIDVRVLSSADELPNPQTISDSDKNAIYIIDNGDTYLDAMVYNSTKQDYSYLESAVRFSDYALKTSVYTKDDTYSKQQIDNLLCNIQDKIIKINNIMGDTGAIIIPDDE